MKYIIFSIGCIASYFAPIASLCWVVVGLYVVDFITGTAASFKEGVFLRSSILRWSFVKIFVYLGHAALIFFVCDKMGMAQQDTLKVLKVMMWGIVYIEGLSINENLLRIYPASLFLRLMHYLLSIEFLKYVPVIANFFKENKDKNVKK